MSLPRVRLPQNRRWRIRTTESGTNWSFRVELTAGACADLGRLMTSLEERSSQSAADRLSARCYGGLDRLESRPLSCKGLADTRPLAGRDCRQSLVGPASRHRPRIRDGGCLRFGQSGCLRFRLYLVKTVPDVGRSRMQRPGRKVRAVQFCCKCWPRDPMLRRTASRHKSRLINRFKIDPDAVSVPLLRHTLRT